MSVKPTNYDEQYTGLLWGGATVGSAAGGDLGGTLPNPTVTGINGITVLGTPTDGQELVYSSASNAWIPESETASGLSSITDGVVTVSPATSATVPLGGVTDLGSGDAGLNFVPNVNGALEKVHTVASSGASQSLDWSVANEFDLTLTAACTLTFANVPNVAGFGSAISVILRGSAYGVTLPGSVTLLNADPGTALRVLVLWTTDGGTTFGGVYTGGTVSPLTAKGDVWGYATKDARIPVGPDGSFLMAQSIAPNGVSWQAPSMWLSHAHITGEPFTGDGSTTTFVLANEADIYDVAAYVAGSRTDVTVDATGHTVTFASAPANAAAVRIDYVAAVT